MFKKKSLKYSVAILYFLLTIFLFLLPGSAFPKENIFNKILWFDKWVHVGMFMILILLFCWALLLQNRKNYLIIFFAACIYGLVVEIVQDAFIANRSFDWGDWLADNIGSIGGILVWDRYIKK